MFECIFCDKPCKRSWCPYTKENMKEAITFADVLLVPQYSDIQSRADVDISVTSKCGKIKLGLPIFSANMDTIASVTMAKWLHGHGAVASLHRFTDISTNCTEWLASPPETFCSLGFNDNIRLEHLYEAGCRNFMVDIAHGHCKQMGEFIQFIKKFYMNIVVVAGNVATADGARFLVDNGADIVKIGIGPGAACSTRSQTGHGYPQLDAIFECTKAVPNNSCIADGGLKKPGDMVKALAAGADYLMVGSMLAGTFATPGDLIADVLHRSDISGESLDNKMNFAPVGDTRSYVFSGKMEKTYRGMASAEVYERYNKGGVQKSAEGVSVTVPYKNEDQSNAIIQDIVGGLRSGLTYSGARNVRQLQEKAKWVKITGAGREENKTLADK